MDPKKNTTRRDKLISMEHRARMIWERNQYFTVEPSTEPKFFMTFPFPYMNGKLHLGHAFSLTKCDFNAWYKRLCGFNVLFPFGFHCTGNELAMQGCQFRQPRRSCLMNSNNLVCLRLCLTWPSVKTKTRNTNTK